MTEGMMGRGSDTRIYNPRSESSYMFRNNHEEDTYGHEDGYNKDKRMDKKQAKKEFIEKNPSEYLSNRYGDYDPPEPELDYD